MEADSLTEDAKRKDLQNKYLVMKKTFDLLPDADNNVKMLQDISSKSAMRLIELVSNDAVLLLNNHSTLLNCYSFQGI